MLIFNDCTMRKIAFYIIVLGAGLLGSCKLTDVTDITPPYQLSEETVITDIPSAEKVLIGAYAQLHQFDLIVNASGAAGALGLSFESGASGGAAYAEFANNDVVSTNYLLSGIYTRWYYLINISSHIIEKTARLESADVRKEQIVAEASVLRALAHFSLLRLFGRFYDTSSEYGIVTWDQPVNDITPKARSTVQDSYALIVSDLEYAAGHAPEYASGIYASKPLALGLLAKVLLYRKEYEKAAEVAGRAIQQRGAAVLEPVFTGIFTKWFNSKEVLLAPPFDDKNERNNKAFAFRAYWLPTQRYRDLMAGDNRQDATVFISGTALRCGKFQNTTAGGQTLTANTEYFLRLAEVYLIQAEALIRSSNGTANFQAARNALNVIRGRADEDLIDASVNTKAALLQAVLKEKQFELGCESGEEWFDLVRFTTEGDLNVKDYKPNVINETRYIVPVPDASIRAANGVVKQNPGYE